MSRIRTVKPEFWTSAQVLECSLNARLLFIGLWNFCDDKGRHPASAKQIKAEVFPADEITLDTIHGWLMELDRNGLIQRYLVDDVEYLVVTGWHHQKINRPQPNKYPGPEDAHSLNDPGAVTPDTIGKDRKGEDRTRREGKGVDTKGEKLIAREEKTKPPNGETSPSPVASSPNGNRGPPADQEIVVSPALLQTKIMARR